MLGSVFCIAIIGHDFLHIWFSIDTQAVGELIDKSFDERALKTGKGAKIEGKRWESSQPCVGTFWAFGNDTINDTKVTK